MKLTVDEIEYTFSTSLQPEKASGAVAMVDLRCNWGEDGFCSVSILASARPDYPDELSFATDRDGQVQRLAARFEDSAVSGAILGKTAELRTLVEGAFSDLQL